MNDLLEFRVGRLSLMLFLGKPFIRFGWNRIPNLLRSFGWFFVWWRGKRPSWDKGA